MPGQQFGGQGGDGEPDPVLVGVVEGQVAHPGVLRRPDAVLDAGVAAVAQFQVGELAAGPAGVVLVRNPVTRSPSASVIRSCAPGCGRSLRRISRVPGGQEDMSTRPVASATQAPSRGSICTPCLGGAGFAGLIRRGPRLRRERGERGGDVEVPQRGPDGELHPVPVQVGGEVLGGAGGVGADQHRHPPLLVAGPQRGG